MGILNLLLFTRMLQPPGCSSEVIGSKAILVALSACIFVSDYLISYAASISFPVCIRIDSMIRNILLYTDEKPALFLLHFNFSREFFLCETFAALRLVIMLFSCYSSRWFEVRFLHPDSIGFSWREAGSFP